MTRKREPAFGYLQGNDLRDAHVLIRKIVECKQEAARLNLWKTVHGLHQGEKAVGWEVAGRIPIQ